MRFATKLDCITITLFFCIMLIAFMPQQKTGQAPVENNKIISEKLPAWLNDRAIGDPSGQIKLTVEYDPNRPDIEINGAPWDPKPTDSSIVGKG